MYPIEIRNEPARKVVGVQHVGPYPEIGGKFEAFGAMCQSRDLWSNIGPMIGVYFDNPDEIPEAALQSLAGAEWKGAEVPEGMVPYDLPAGRYVVMTYTGPYAGLGAAYDSLFGEWFPNSGEMPANSPCFEISRNDPSATKPEDLITEICVALEG